LPLRKDLQKIFDVISPNSKILDLGCGDGVLLHELIEKKNASGLGIEISVEKIKSCLEYGISVLQEDLNEGLKDFQENSFDYVILSQTLEYITNPIYLIQEMLRVGKKCIVSFENIANWKNRISFLLKGTLKRKKSDKTYLLTSKRIQILTVKKFLTFCDVYNIKIYHKIYLPLKKFNLASIFPNLFSHIAIFILEGSNSTRSI
jgi:methionine biosynthesis protein MetW